MTAFPTGANQGWQRWPQRLHRKRRRKYDAAGTGFLRFLFSNFRYSLTLFSKFFSSFPHGTCTLSVSHQYLALDGIYHPLRAAIPNNSTRRHGLDGQDNGSITLSAVLFQGTWPGTMNAHVHRPQFNAKNYPAPIHTVSSSRFSRPY